MGKKMASQELETYAKYERYYNAGGVAPAALRKARASR